MEILISSFFSLIIIFLLLWQARRLIRALILIRAAEKMYNFTFPYIIGRVKIEKNFKKKMGPYSISFDSDKSKAELKAELKNIIKNTYDYIDSRILFDCVDFLQIKKKDLKNFLKYIDEN